MFYQVSCSLDFAFNFFQRRPLIEEVGDKLETKGRPLIEECREQDVSTNSKTSNSNATIPVIEEINERFSQLDHLPKKPGRPLIEELGTVGDGDYIEAERHSTKPLVTEVLRDSSEGKDPGHDAADKQSTDLESPLGPTWATLQKLAEQVGSTIEREPIDITKEKKAFVKRMHPTNLGDLD